MNSFSATAAIIAYSHRYYRVFTINPARANPIIFPKSPFADHVPIAVPSFSKLNCGLEKSKKTKKGKS